MTINVNLRPPQNNNAENRQFHREDIESDAVLNVHHIRADRVNPARRKAAPEFSEKGTGYSGKTQTIEAPPSPGLTHSYLIDPDDDRRLAIHRMLTGRSNMIVRAYKSRENFLAVADTLDEGCVILADHGDCGDLVPFIHRLREEQRFACVLLASEHDIRTAVEAMKAGAVDCLLYPAEAAGLLSSVDNALMRIQRLVENNAVANEARRHIDRLTSREKDVLHGLLQGKSNKMIALDLHISPRTVEIYRAHLMEKLGTHSLSETLKVAFAAGMGDGQQTSGTA